MRLEGYIAMCEIANAESVSIGEKQGVVSRPDNPMLVRQFVCGYISSEILHNDIPVEEGNKNLTLHYRHSDTS